jgi:hypothetical protein
MAVDKVCATCRFSKKQAFNPPWVQCHYKMPCHANMPKYSKQTDTCDLWSIVENTSDKPKDG